ncbi:AcrR family transcriptional regulator [Skermanella aerolata]|uniref:TetR/AcrR family transcriptional regulator n=1 Tax=Skermanella aerolata TaxID=393310 RepID=UPI003D26243C
MAGLRARHRQARVEQVLNVASELFASQGYETTRIEEIAESAQVAPATVYNYFTTKANILTTLAVRHVRASLPERRALVRDPPADPMDAIRAFEKLLADQALRTLSRECWRAILSAPYREPRGTAHRVSLRFQWLIKRHYVLMLTGFQERGTIKKGVDLDVLADLVTAIGTYHFSRLVSDDEMTIDDLKEAVERHLDLVFAGVIAQPNPKAPKPKSTGPKPASKRKQRDE